MHEPDLAAVPARRNLQPGERVHGHHVGLGSAHVAQDDAAPRGRVGSHQHKDRLGGRNSSHAAAPGGAPADAEARRRSRLAGEVLRVLDGHLSQRDFLVAGRYTIADIAVYGYTHRAAEAGVALEPFPGVTGWIERVEAQPGHIEDVMPYGANAVPGAGRSIYD